MNIWGNTVTDTVLAATWFRDLFAHIMMLPLYNLPIKCDICGTSFDVRHRIRYSKGGIIIARHKKLCDKLLYLAQWAFPSAYVSGKPLTHHGRIISEGVILQGSERLDTRGHIIIQGLWDIQTDNIVDVKLRNDDAYTYRFDPMLTLLGQWKKMNKNKHGNY